MFRTLLKFRTVTAEGPRGSYAACVGWLTGQCEAAGFSTEVVEPVAGKPILVATLLGTEPELPCVILNSHYDVVPADEAHWDVDPWAAVVTEEDGGRIYGRGTQDMKCVCAQYLLALQVRGSPRGSSRRRCVIASGKALAGWLSCRACNVGHRDWCRAVCVCFSQHTHTPRGGD